MPTVEEIYDAGDKLKEEGRLPEAVEQYRQCLETDESYALAHAALGVVPVVGDAADFLFRSNTRNLRIVKKHLDKHHPHTGIIEG